MSIILTIMRPEPITQQEFEDLIQGDPELDFISLYNKTVGSYKDFDFSFGMGSIDIQYMETMTDADIGKFIAIADKLNGRLFEEAGGTFFRTPQETYEDEDFFGACQEKSQIFIKYKPMKFFTRKEFLFVGGSLALLIAFLIFINYNYVKFQHYLRSYWYIVVVPLILLYIWSWVKDWLKLWPIKRRATGCEKEIADTMKQFLDHLRQLAGQEKVLLILSSGVSMNPNLKAIKETLKDNTVVEKTFAAGAGTIITPKSLGKINAEIQKSRACRTIIFFDAFSWEHIPEELKTLDIMNNPPENSPRIVIFQLMGYCESSSSPFVPELSKLASTGKISAALCMGINQTYSNGRGWIPQAMAVYSFGIQGLPDGIRNIKQGGIEYGDV